MTIRTILGRKNRRPKRPIRIVFKEGRLQIEGLGTWYSYWRDPYHLMLTIPWPGFITLVFVGYLLINVLFALLYLPEPNNLNGARSGSFEDAFFFSVQTLASIGYGVISPKTTYANIIVTLEAITSLLLIAVVTGLAFARFSRPTARIVFSQVAVITPYNQIPTLAFRAANKRRNFILEAQAKVYLLKDEVTLEGEFIRRFYELSLIRDRNPSFSLSWTIMHSIDESSPLYGVTPEYLEKVRAQLIVSLGGVDETVSYNINSRFTYSYQDIVWNHRFVDIILKSTTGDRYLDYTHFHHTLPNQQNLIQRHPSEEEQDIG